jgi:DNA-binding transcriptional regulator GbsR (MarR family)
MTRKDEGQNVADETSSSDDAQETVAADESRTDDAVETAREEVIEAMARSAEVYGAKRSYGRLYGILFFEDEALSLDELVEHSEYAKSTVSTAMNTLDRYHMVRRRSVSGEGKKAFYEAETDFWYIFQQFLQQEVQREIQIMSRALDDAIKTLEASDSEQAERDLEKLRELRSLYQRGEKLIGVVTSQSLDRLASLFGTLSRDR